MLSWMIKQGYKDNLLILTDEIAFKYWSTNKILTKLHINISTQILLYEPMISLNMSSFMMFREMIWISFRNLHVSDL